MADDGDFLGAFEVDRHGDGADGTGDRAGDDVAGVAEPDELFFFQAEGAGEQSIQARINAGEGGQRQAALVDMNC